MLERIWSAASIAALAFFLFSAAMVWAKKK
jgi:hypothetical protein